jgi:short-subunit dehydrogenase
VNISSTGAKIAIPLLGSYSSSKCGLEGMSDALRRELMLFGIDVVIIEPGTVHTAMYVHGMRMFLICQAVWGGFVASLLFRGRV